MSSEVRVGDALEQLRLMADEGVLRRRAYRPAPEPDGQLGLLGERE